MSETKAFLKENVYVFKTLNTAKPEDVYLTSKSKVFVVINGKETTIPIEKLFVIEPEVDTTDITGYSILQMLVGDKLKIDENTSLEITFIDQTNGTRFYISKIRRPFVYDDDFEITTAGRLQYIDLLLNAVVQESRPVALPSEKSAEELKAEADLQEKLNQPGGAEWESIRAALIENGCTEYVDDKYRFFFREANENSPAAVSFYVLEPGDFFEYELYEDDITPEMEVYSYEDFDRNEWTIKFDRVNNTVKVDQYSEA